MTSSAPPRWPGRWSPSWAWATPWACASPTRPTRCRRAWPPRPTPRPARCWPRSTSARWRCSPSTASSWSASRRRCWPRRSWTARASSRCSGPSRASPRCPSIPASPPSTAPDRVQSRCMAGRFVVQLHDATTLHYDFRLEVDGTLRSWAVPKGPSTDPGQRRLAVEVGDHALAHLTHESARVEIWDTGTFRNLDADRSIAEALDAGHARFWLDGRRLQGGWTLHRTGDGRGPKTQWLLMKRRDDEEHA